MNGNSFFQIPSAWLMGDNPLDVNEVRLLSHLACYCDDDRTLTFHPLSFCKSLRWGSVSTLENMLVRMHEKGFLTEVVVMPDGQWQVRVLGLNDVL